MNDIEPLGKKELALNKAGATRENAYNAMVEALKATIVKYDRDGECLGESPDYSTRLKSAELISRLNGDLKDTLTVDNRTVVITGVSADVVKVLTDMVKDVGEQLRALRGNGMQTGEIIDVQL